MPAAVYTRPHNAAVVGDLHLFCRRSAGEGWTRAVRDAANDAETLVLTGDVVDYRWSRYRTPEATAEAGRDWLEGLLLAAPKARIHYVLGNHDCHEVHCNTLERIARRHPRLSVHPHHLRLGDAVFLHGDVAHRPMTEPDLAAQRRRWRQDRRKGPLVNGVYDAAFALGVHKAIQRAASPPDRVTAHLRHYLDAAGLGPDAGVRHVYFGHTHAALRDYDAGGLRYHNSGAPFPGLDFGILRASLDAA